MAVPQVLAITFTVAFEGLMMFQGDGNHGRKHVAIVEAAHHSHPAITVCKRSESGYVPPCTLLAELVKGDKVIFNPSVPAKPTILYKGYVPALRTYVTSGDLDPDVDGGINAAGVRAFVWLPAGTLTTWKTFDDPVRLTTKDGKPEVTCFSRYVILSASNSTATTVEITHANDPKRVAYTIVDNDLIFVSNSADNDPSDHFPLYKALLKSTTGTPDLGKMEVLHNVICKSFVGIGQFDATIEKALDDHAKGQLAVDPRGDRNPHGDCGPVDNGG